MKAKTYRIKFKDSDSIFINETEYNILSQVMLNPNLNLSQKMITIFREDESMLINVGNINYIETLDFYKGLEES